MAHTFLTPPIIVYGEDALQQAKSHIIRSGKKALIVTSTTMVELQNVKQIENLLLEANLSYSIFSEVNDEPTDTIVELGLKQYRDEQCDFLIALGGGSPLDAMKAIALMSNSTSHIAEYTGISMEFERPTMIAIPTTAGTGSEATQFTIITDTKNDVKLLLKGSKAIPDIAIIDPRFTLSAPPQVSATTGIDALCHAVEAYTSKKAQPMSNSFAISAVKRIFQSLLVCYKDQKNMEARTQMAMASLEAGIAFNNASVTIIHGMSRPIGALFHVPHGLSNAMLLEPCMHFIRDGAIPQLASLARHCEFTSSTDDEVAADCFIQEVSTLLVNLEIQTLEQFGVQQKNFEKVIDKMTVDALASGSPANTLKDVSANNIKNIYNQLYK